ncbi:MAG: 30S ribosome-binding factor RbfA [Candidatus Kerfeldbacteria bacterium]|nr:30S ribosome-binding factor RbfA [Candidatus Kerfeldbacteria bacterium]
MSVRTEQVGAVIQRSLSEILHREVEFPEGVLVSILGVKVSRDLHYAKSVISILPKTAESEVLGILRERLGVIRKELGTYLTTKFTPKLTFELDHSQERAHHMNDLLDHLENSSTS